MISWLYCLITFHSSPLIGGRWGRRLGEGRKQREAMDPRPRCLAGLRDLSLQVLTIHHPLEGWHGQRASKQTNDALRPISPHRGTRARKRPQRTLHVINAAKPKACETKAAAAQLFYLQAAAGLKIGKGNQLWITEMTPPTHPGSIMLRPSLLVHFDQGYFGYDERWRCILNPACFSSTPLFSWETLWCSCKLLWRPCESQRAVLSRASQVDQTSALRILLTHPQVSARSATS